MTTQLELANMALSHIGARDNIPSLAENSVEARTVSLWINPSRRQTLEAYNWNFARRRVELQKESPYAYLADFTTTTDKGWGLGFDTVDGTITRVSGSLIFTVGANDGTNPRMVRAIPVTFGQTYSLVIPAPAGTAVNKQIYVSTESDGGVDSAIFTPIENAAVDTTFVAPSSMVYLTVRARTGATGETVSITDVSILDSERTEGDPPPGALGCSFTLPADCLKVREISNPGTPYNYEGFVSYAQPDAVPFTIGLAENKEQRILVTELEEPVIIYTADIEDLTLWPSTAIMAMSYTLAHNICFKITGKMQLADRMIQLFYTFIRTASMQDGNEQVERAPRDAPSIRGRW